MSVYQGFATRQQEQYYIRIVHKIIELFTYKLYHLLKEQEDSFYTKGANDKWFSHIKKAFKLLYKIEKQKYQDPKLAVQIFPFVKYVFSRYKQTATNSDN